MKTTKKICIISAFIALGGSIMAIDFHETVKNGTADQLKKVTNTEEGKLFISQVNKGHVRRPLGAASHEKLMILKEAGLHVPDFCPGCIGEFAQRNEILRCGHCLCSVCHKRLSEAAAESKKIVCPVCKKETLLESVQDK